MTRDNLKNGMIELSKGKKENVTDFVVSVLNMFDELKEARARDREAKS